MSHDLQDLQDRLSRCAHDVWEHSRERGRTLTSRTTDRRLLHALAGVMLRNPESEGVPLRVVAGVVTLNGVEVCRAE